MAQGTLGALQLDEAVLRSFGRGRVFADYEGRINSLAFHRSQDLLVTAADDDSIRVFDTEQGEQRAMLLSKKYGVANIAYTHDSSSVVYSSNKGADYALRYHDLYANRYHRYFRGHTGRVTTLCVHPKQDLMLSAAEDKQACAVRLWDLRSPACQALLQAPGLPTVAYDEQGLVFCVGAESGVVKMYDARQWGQGPFTTFTVEDERNSAAVFAVLRFSLDGSSLLAVVEGRVYVLDSFQGAQLVKVSTGVQEGGTALEAALTADGQFLLSGCEDRTVRVWHVQTGREVARWIPEHADTPTCLKWSPRKMLVATAGAALQLWVPDLEKLEKERQQAQLAAPH
eukprot:scaffold8.g1630.t1